MHHAIDRLKSYALAAGLAVVFVGGLARAAAAQDCKLIRVEEWAVRLEGNLPIVDGEINGRRVGILLDTGAERSLMPRSAVARLALERHELPGSAEAVRLNELRIGPAMRKDWSVLVTATHDFGGETSLVLGRDFLQALDVELDFPNRAVRLFQPRDCAGVALAYWARGGAGSVALEPAPGIVFTVAVNGRPVPATLDTGTPVSALSAELAAIVGLTPTIPGVTPAGCSVGVGRRPVDYWAGPVDSFTIDDETVRNPTLRFANLLEGLPAGFVALPHMVLGMDFLRSHRVLVSQSQRRLYFTYSGGTVFPTGPLAGCRDLRR